MALVAVGGFRRDQLFPIPDVDVLLLLPDGARRTAACAPTLEGFIGSCWDTGLEIPDPACARWPNAVAESAGDVTVQTLAARIALRAAMPRCLPSSSASTGRR